MDLFTYLMAKNDHNTSVKKDLFSYLLGKNQSGTYQEFTGTSISANNTKKGKMKVNLLGNTSQTGTPTPDTPIDVNVVSGDNTIKVCGKNLLRYPYDGTSETIANVSFTLNDDGSILVNGTGNATGYFHFSRTDNKQTLKAGTYTISLQQTGIEMSVSTGSETLAYISRFDTSATFMISEDTDVYIYLAVRSGVSYNNLLVKPMLESGSSATSWEAYTSTSYPINLGTLELCKIGDYQDKFFKNIPNTTDYNSELEDNEWYLEKKIGKVVLDGSENWNVNQRTNAYQFDTTISGKNNGSNSNVEVYCNYFNATYFNNRDNTSNSIYTGNNDKQIRILTNIESTTENFKTWLSTHNTDVYYVLATPTYTPITGTLKDELEAVWRANSYKETTNISQVNNDLPFNLDAEIKVGN